VADATGASQFSDTSTSLVAEPLLLAGAATVRSLVRVTTQSGHANWSPTVDSTTGVKPAPLIALFASLYFCPVTSGDVAATATPLHAKTSAAPGSGGGADPQDRTYAPHQACALTGGTATVVAGTDPGVVRVAVAPIVIAEVAGWT
jgi:hypothetical protein